MSGRFSRGNGRAYAFLSALVGHTGDDCVIWPFSDNGLGYGVFGHLRKSYYAHRFMCELAHGAAPADKPQAAHSCGNGNKGCVNPRHLSWKSNSENQLDRRTHGTLKPDRPVRLTVTPEQIEQMRALKGKVSLFKIAEMLGVKRGVVEYWQKTDRPPVPLKQFGIARERRERKREAFSAGESQ
jgi:DNA-binding transcriptional regulator YiaG